MPRGGPPAYTYTLPAIYLAVPGTTILAVQHNAPLEDIEDVLNDPWPVIIGGTGGTSAITAWDSINVRGTDIATAATLDVDSATGPNVHLTGAVTVTAVSLGDGNMRFAVADSAFLMTASASLVVNGLTSGDQPVAAKSELTFIGGAAGVVYVYISGGAGSGTQAGYTTTATAAGTTTLTVSSTLFQYFTGVTTQTIVMPVTSTLSLGQNWIFVNNSTGALTVNSSGGNLIVTIASGMSARVQCILLTGTTAASWSVIPQRSGIFRDGVLLLGDPTGVAPNLTVTESSGTTTFTPGYGGGATPLVAFRFAGGVGPDSNDGGALGSTVLSWSDLFGATGFVWNIGNGNWVATHTSGILTVGTGDLRVTTAGTNTASVVTVGGTQTLTAKTLTTPTMTGPIVTTTAMDLQVGQIAFPATQNPSANANTLDDYEEGDWTPTMTFNASSTGVTYSANSGKYIKVGQLVYATGRITLTSNGSGVGTARIASLPFTSLSNVSLVPGRLRLTAGGSAATSIYPAVDNNATTATLYIPGAASDAAATDTNATDTFSVDFAIVYQAAA